MAMTATIALSPATVYINQPVVATVTVSNSGASTVNMTGITPTAILTGASQPNPPGAALGAVPFGPGTTVAVAASGTLKFTFQTIFFSPSTGPIGAGTGTYDIGCVCTSADGSIFSPTAGTVTVNPLPLPVSEQ